MKVDSMIYCKNNDYSWTSLFGKYYAHCLLLGNIAEYVVFQSLSANVFFCKTVVVKDLDVRRWPTKSEKSHKLVANTTKAVYLTFVVQTHKRAALTFSFSL